MIRYHRYTLVKTTLYVFNTHYCTLTHTTRLLDSSCRTLLTLPVVVQKATQYQKKKCLCVWCVFFVHLSFCKSLELKLKALQ